MSAGSRFGTPGKLGLGPGWNDTHPVHARVRPVFNRTAQGIRPTYPGTAPIPNLSKRRKGANPAL